jgi:hypothetical protein
MNVTSLLGIGRRRFFGFGTSVHVTSPYNIFTGGRNRTVLGFGNSVAVISLAQKTILFLVPFFYCA